MVKDSADQSAVESSQQNSKMNGHLFLEQFSLPCTSSYQSKSNSNVRCKPFSSLNNSSSSITSQNSSLMPVKLSKFSKRENTLKSPDFLLSRSSKSCFASDKINIIQTKSSFPDSPKKTECNFGCNGYTNQSPKKENDTGVELFEISKRKAESTLYRKMFGVFKEYQDVLARWSDGLYYLGTVQQVRDFEHRCYVQFEDKSMCWVQFKDLQPIVKENTLSDCSESDVTCAICRDGKSEKPNEIVLCDKCGQGFHQLCHAPHIDSKVVSDEEETWQCRMCVFAAVAKRGGAEQEGPAAATLKQMKQELPYDINSLTWDKGHKSNNEETYCYCGGPGDWYLKMLQCCRCLQWFHEACLQCLDHPVLYGDRFYLFVCSICNSNEEFIKRLPMRWVDVVHLVLYNITITKTNKYYDFISNIIPFFAHNWDSLRLGELVLEASTRTQLKDRVLETLQNSKSRFQCGMESKKAKMSWGLRTRSPPTPPTLNVPSTGMINESLFQSMDLRHGSLLLVESPTPLKRGAPGDFHLSDSPPHKISSTSVISGRSPIKINGHTEGNFNPGTDNLFEKFYSMGGDMNKSNETGDRNDIPEKRKRGRPRKNSVSKFVVPPPSPASNSRLPSGGYEKSKKKEISKVQKEASTFASENSVIPITELFRDVPGSKNSEPAQGSDAYDQDLRRTMARYYGAEGRIACGERFNVLAKRVLNYASSGEGPRVEYLIEWEGYTAPQLQASVQKR